MTIGDVLHKLVQNVRWFAQSEEEAAHNEIDKFIHAFGLEPATPTGVPTELTVEQDQANQIAELQARLSAQAAPENDVPVDTRAAAAPETVVDDKAQKIADLEAQLASLKS